MGARKFAVLVCTDDSDYVKKIYGGYFGVFVRMLEEEGEEWRAFRVWNGEFPAEEDISDCEGFVITGSCADAHGSDLWICELLALLRRLVDMKKKVLGICFGHQILGLALGGKVGRANAGWDIGITQVHFFPSQIFASLKMPASLAIIEGHRDEVWELPPEAEVLAWSNKTGVEMFRYGEHMMGIQGHPEYTKDILFNIVDRLHNLNVIEECLVEESKTKVEGSEPDKEAWKKLCTSFLKGRL